MLKQPPPYVPSQKPPPPTQSPKPSPAPLHPPPKPPPPSAYKSSLTSPAYLQQGQSIKSQSGNAILIMQHDGNLDLNQINADSTSTLIRSAAGSNGIYFAVQNDGGLVVYGYDNYTYFDSNTEGIGIGPYTLTLYDYYIELTDKTGLKIWNNNAGILYKNVYASAPSSITSVSYLYANTQTAIMSASKSTVLIMQHDGNLALNQINADNTSTYIWSAAGSNGIYCALQNDGGLVIYGYDNYTYFDSGTESMGIAPYTLTVYDYYIELTDKNKLKIWNNNAGILYKNVYPSAPSSIVSTSYLYANTQTALMSASKNTVLIMQYNGALVLYQINADNTSTNIWQVGAGYGGIYCALQNDGGLVVVYDAYNDTCFDSGTENMGIAPYTLTVYDYYIELTDKNKLKI